MTQEERWMIHYNEVKTFIETYHRNPSKYAPLERGAYCNWLRHNKKLYSAGELKEPRLGLFRELMQLSEKYKHINQYI